MAKVYRKIGSLNELLKRLKGWTSWSSLDEVLHFEHNFKIKDKELYQREEKIFLDKLGDKTKKLEDLSNKYSVRKNNEENSIELETKLNMERIRSFDSKLLRKNFFSRIILEYEKQRLLKKQDILLVHHDEIIRQRLLSIEKEIKRLDSEIKEFQQNKDQYIKNNPEVKNLEAIHKIIQENNFFVIGAIGEGKVLDELKKLPDSFYVINDFKHEFDRSIPNNKEPGDYIKTIQIDHVVVGPTGLFLIETKNWSDKSMDNKNIYSPIKQISRHSYAMFVYLNNLLRSGLLESFSDRHGEQKISPKSILATTSSSPTAEYQFVKTLRPYEIPNFIGNQKPIFNTDNIEDIVSEFNIDKSLED